MTQTRKEALTDLLAKVEAGAFTPDPSDARAPYFNRFSRIAEMAFPQDVRACNVLAFDAYKGSLDAAKALHEAVLHEAAWVNIAYAKRYEDEARAEITLGKGTWQARAENPARAWLIAILKALIAQEPDQ